MMHRTRLLAAPLLLVLLVSATPALLAVPKGKNLLENGGFEKQLDGWEPRNPSGVLSVEVVTKGKKSGKRAAYVVKEGGPDRFLADGLACTVEDLPVGVKVKVSAQVRGEDVQNAWMKFRVYDAGGESLLDHVDLNDSAMTGTFDWRELSAEFEIPEEAVRAELMLLLFKDGKVWLDDVEIVPQGTPKKSAKPKVSPLPASTRKWLDEHSVAIDNTTLRGKLDDLEPLKELIGDARIVQLGENTHRDGECFAAKARLIRFLHEEMGFEVLAFESSLYACDRANELLRKGDGDGALRGGVFGIWNNQIVENLFVYMAQRSKEKPPLVLAGFDCRASGTLDKELLDDMAQFMAPAGESVSAEDLDALKRLDALIHDMDDGYAPPKKDLDAALAAWKRVRAAFDEHRAAITEKHGEESTELYSRVLDNWSRNEAFERSKTDDSMGKHGSTNLRDGAMSDNLIWLAKTRYPDKKIITWGATFHLARALEQVSIDGDADTYVGCRNMGQGVHEEFGDQVFTVGFAAYGGEGGAFGKTFKISKPHKDSIEDVLYRYEKPLLIVDLRPEMGPFRERLKMAPMSYSRSMEAVWPEVIDAVFYIEEMTPAR